MNTGEHLWWVPVGETPKKVLDHPAVKGKDIGNTGSGTVAQMVVTPTLLMYTDVASDGTPHLFAINKTTGKSVGKVEIEEKTNYGIMTYTDEGRQYVILQTGPTLTAVALPSDSDDHMDAH